MAVVLVLLATIANATALVLQRKAAQDSARARGIAAGRLSDMVQRPAWIVGMVILASGLGLQATALSIGSIALVQPVLVMELPFTLLLGWWVLGGALRRYEWTAVAVMSVGLATLLISLRPSGGDALGAGNAVWLIGSAVTIGALALAMAMAKRSRSVTRAALYGVSAGVGSGFVAVIIKAMSQALITDGLVGVLTTWQSYLLLPVGPMAFLALQHALRSGRLIASQPGLILANPLLSAFWGVALLGEQVRGGAAAAGGTVGAILMTVGVFLLSRSPLLAAQEGGPRDAGTAGRRRGDPSRRRPT